MRMMKFEEEGKTNKNFTTSGIELTERITTGKKVEKFMRGMDKRKFVGKEDIVSKPPE